MSQESGQPKKFNDPLNIKIQKKFDQVFQLSDSTSSIQTSELDLLEESMNFNSPSGETKMNQKNSKNEEEPKIDFDFSDDGDDASAAGENSSDLTKPTAVMPNSKDNDLGFSIDFNFDDENTEAAIETKAAATSETSASSKNGLDLGEDEGFTIEGLDHSANQDEEDDDRTRVTEAAFSLKDLKKESSQESASPDEVEEMNFV